MYLQINYKVVARREGDVAAMCADPKKAEAELGWKATYSLDDMCKFTANAWIFCSAFQDILNRVLVFSRCSFNNCKLQMLGLQQIIAKLFEIGHLLDKNINFSC